MFEKFCKNNNLGPVIKGAFLWWIDRNHYGWNDQEDLGVLWSAYMEEERKGIDQKLAEIRGKSNDA